MSLLVCFKVGSNVRDFGSLSETRRNRELGDGVVGHVVL